MKYFEKFINKVYQAKVFNFKEMQGEEKQI